MLHATWLHLPGAVAKFNYSCTINRLTYINIYIAEMQSVANGFMGRSSSLSNGEGGSGVYLGGLRLSCAPAYANSFPWIGPFGHSEKWSCGCNNLICICICCRLWSTQVLSDPLPFSAPFIAPCECLMITR